MELLRDRTADYLNFEIGTPFIKDAYGHFPFQTDCIDFLFRRQRPLSQWQNGAPVIVLPSLGTDSAGELATLVAPAGTCAWEVLMEHTQETEVHSMTELWCPMSGRPNRVLAVLLPPGYGKTAIAAAFVSKLPPQAKVLYLTKTGLLSQTEKSIRRWCLPPSLPVFLPRHPTVAGTKKGIRMAAISGETFLRSSYAVAKSFLREDECLEKFDVLIFDEAHADAKCICEALSFREDWGRPYPRALLLSGSPGTFVERRAEWFRDIVDDHFYLSGGGKADSALGMPRVCFQMSHSPPQSDFDCGRYVLAIVDMLQSDDTTWGDKRCFGVALLWWAYFKESGGRIPIWGEAVHGKFAWTLLRAMEQKLVYDYSTEAKRRETEKRILSEYLSSGLVYVYRKIAEAAGRPDDALVERLWSERNQDVPLPALPPQKELDPLAPIWLPRLFHLAPPMKEWKKLHTEAYRWKNDKANSLVDVAVASLRVKRGEPVPKVLMCIPDMSLEKRREALSLLCNLPKRNQLCNDLCHSTCKKSHDASRFRKDGKLQHSFPPWLLQHQERRQIHGRIQEACPGSLLYVITPDMAEKDRTRAIQLFNDQSHEHIRTLRPLRIQGEKSKTHVGGFLKVLLKADIYDVLVAYINHPQLCIAFGETLTLGWNGQERFNGLAIPSCEFDPEIVMQRVGRLQRPCRGYGNIHLAISVFMPVLADTIERVLLAEVFQSQQVRADSKVLGVEISASKEDIEAAMRKKGRLGLTAGKRLLEARRLGI